MIILWSSYDHLMIILWSSYNHLTIILWSTYSHLTIILRSPYNHLMIISWYSYNMCILQSSSLTIILLITMQFFAYIALLTFRIRIFMRCFFKHEQNIQLKRLQILSLKFICCLSTHFYLNAAGLWYFYHAVSERWFDYKNKNIYSYCFQFEKK